MKLKKVLSIFALSTMLITSSVISPLHTSTSISAATTFLRSQSIHNYPYSLDIYVDYTYNPSTGEKQIIGVSTSSVDSRYDFYSFHSQTHVSVIVYKAGSGTKVDTLIYGI